MGAANMNSPGDAMDSHFEELLEQVYAIWLRAMASADGIGSNKIDMEFIEQFYDSEIAPAAEASGSRLLIQLDWILYGAVCSVLKAAHVVCLDEIRKDRLKERFHHLLLTVGIPQLKRETEADGSFDLEELAAYLGRCGLAEIK
jgi:hypothetical protein